MKKYLVLATVFLMSSYAQAATMTWYGSAGWRYSKSTQNDGTTNRGTTVGSNNEMNNERTEKAHQFRGALGATGGWDNVEWGVGVRTTGATLANFPSSSQSATIGTAPANSDWGTANGNGTDLGLGLENAWFKYGNDWGFGDIGLTFGRQAVAFANGRNQVLIDNDVRMDGVSETWQWGSFGLNLGQYILGARSTGTDGASQYVETAYSSKNVTTPSNFAVLYSFQPTFKWKFSDEVAAMFAVGYHHWSGATGTRFQNFIPNNGTNGFGTATAVNGSVWQYRVPQENSKQWQFLANVSLPFMLNLDFELISNKEFKYQSPTAAGAITTVKSTVAQDKTAWAAGLTYGALKKSHDFTIGYAYHSKGLGAVATHYTYDRVQAGFKGHEISAAYNIANNFAVNAKYMSLEEKSGKVQAGTDSGKSLQTKMWEVGTGVKF